MKTALITAIGSFAADIVIKTLKENGYFVIGCDIYNREWVAQSLETDEFYQAPLAVNREEYIGFLKKICIEKKVDFLMPLTDVEIDVLNSCRSEFAEAGTVLCISDEETISLCRDKRRLEQVIRQSQICAAIPSATFENEKEAIKKAEEMDWSQVVLKPYNGRSSSGLYRVYDRKKLPCYLGLIDNQEDYVMQPLVEGSIITVDVVRDDKEKKTICIPRRELLRTQNGAGTSVEVFRDEKLEGICMKIAEVLNIRGCVNFEFIEEEQEETYYFMECNPRFSGGAAFSSAAGYDVVMNHMRVFDGQPIETENTAVPMFLARKYEEYRMKNNC